MEMCYDGSIVMPSSFVEMSHEEMEYLEGGGPWDTAKAIVYGALAAAVGWMAKTAISAASVQLILGFAGGWIVGAVNSMIFAAIANPALACVVGTTVVAGVYALGVKVGVIA